MLYNKAKQTVLPVRARLAPVGVRMAGTARKGPLRQGSEEIE